ncbi:MAG: EI24 domain-containing protein [Campylobacterota bacterium]|nr:EI24 domain-containing protein [Campylobacterota bacterium]
MNETNLFLLSIKDFSTPKMLKMVILPFIITILVMYTLFFVAADFGLDALQQSTLQIESSQTLNSGGVEHTENFSGEFTGSSIVEFLLKHTITSWLLTFLIYTVGSFLVLLVSVVVALAVIGFLTPPILKELKERHYSTIELVGFDGMSMVIWNFFKSFLIMILLFLLLTPLYFVPLINIVALNLPFYYFFHKLLTYDVASTLCTKEEYFKIMHFKGNSMRLKTFLLYLISLIPFAVLVATVFFVIYIGHSFFKEVALIRAESHS